MKIEMPAACKEGLVIRFFNIGMSYIVAEIQRQICKMHTERNPARFNGTIADRRWSSLFDEEHNERHFLHLW